MGKFINNHSRLWIIGLTLILIFAGFKGLEAKSLPIDHDIRIDGDIDDWNNIPIDAYDKDQVGVAMCNDDQNLYMLFRFQDQDWARMIRTSGLTIWIDQKGGKDKKFGIRYNGGPSPEEIMKNLPDDVKARMANMSDDQKARMESRMQEHPVRLEVVDKKADQLWPLDSVNSYGVEIKYAFSDGFYTYEAKIPLKIISADFYGIELKPGQKMALGAEWGGLGEFRDRMHDRPEGGGGFTGNWPEGGSRGGGMGRPPGGVMRHTMPEKQEVWIKFDLASSSQINNEAE